MGIKFLVQEKFWSFNEEHFNRIVKDYKIEVLLYNHDDFEEKLKIQLDIVESDKTRPGKTKQNILFVSEKTGVFSFNMACKRKKVVCAAIENEHSALMTRLHNNANVVVFNWLALAPRGLVSAMDMFLSTQFEGGRHIARLEMLEKEVV